MPTISEDGVDRTAGIFDDDNQLANSLQDRKIEQLMVSMLDQRDKLTEQLQKMQHRNDEVEDCLRESEREKESLRRQLELQSQHLPGVCLKFKFNILTVLPFCFITTDFFMNFELSKMFFK